MPKQLMVNNKDMVKTLKISNDTHARLKKFGQFGDSFEDILNRLMNIAEGKEKK